MARRKVFCLGFQKTGTSSLGRALEHLGHRVVGYHPFRDLAKRQDLNFEALWQRARCLAKAHDAVQDMPWPIFYRELDDSFPGSKFILVRRESADWIKSVMADFGEDSTTIRRLIYGVGCPIGNEDAYIARYERHSREVEAYFASRPGDFLSLRLEEVSWETLCPFLGVDVPAAPFPHVNKRGVKRMMGYWWRARARLTGS